MRDGEEAVHEDLLACLTLGDACPFIASSDPRLVYFAAGLFVLYAFFFSVLLVDVFFWWNIDELEKTIYYYINMMRMKLDVVQTNQQHFDSLLTQTEEEMVKSQDALKNICLLRSIARDLDPSHFDNMLSALPVDKVEQDTFSKWHVFDDL